MLVELKDIRQNDGEPFRRIFNGFKMYLILWNETEKLVAFQINYTEESETLSLTWDSEKGFSHKVIEEGENRPFRHKMSQMLLTERPLVKQKLIETFSKESENLELSEKHLVLHQLKNYK
ncbi:MAG: hypothetical protein ACI8RA_003146 [Chlamydiales bacterium]|jgi:hypothetical protein